MPRILLYIALLLVAVTLVPLGMIYKSQHDSKSQTRIQVIPDMDSQVKYKPQTMSGFFADGVTMRERPAGTVIFGQDNLSEEFNTGMIIGMTSGLQDTVFVADLPLEMTPELLDRGQERFAIYCAPCHGYGGKGDGPVHRRATELGEGTWTPPTDLTGETVRARSVGHIFHTITAGIRNMPAYAAQIETADRWAITAHVRSLESDGEGE